MHSNSLTGRIDRHVAQFLTGGWLEVFLWGLLDRRQDRLGIGDVRLGIEPASRGTKANNDFDIAFMRNFSLHMIECKSGSQAHDRGVNALYKIEAVTRQFGALRVRSFLATTSGNLLDGQGNIKQALRDRASLYGCRFLTKAHIEKLAASVDEPEVVETLLFKNTGRA